MSDVVVPGNGDSVVPQLPIPITPDKVEATVTLVVPVVDLALKYLNNAQANDMWAKVKGVVQSDWFPAAVSDVVSLVNNYIKTKQVDTMKAMHLLTYLEKMKN